METTGSQPSWKNQFKATHDLEAIKSPELRDQFSDFLDLRAGSRDYLVQIKDEDFDKSLTGGDSPKTELVNHIGNTILRNTGLITGTLPTWKYVEFNSQHYKRLQDLGKDGLIDEFDKTTDELYRIFASGQVKPVIALPFGKTNTAAKYMEWMIRHETGHEFFLIDVGLMLHIPRPQSVIALWGPGA